MFATGSGPGKQIQNDFRYNQEFKETIQFLKTVERRFLERAKRVRLPRLRNGLMSLARALHEKQKEMEEDSGHFWRDVLFASEEERKNWHVDMETLRPVPPLTKNEDESIFAALRSAKNLQRRSDLDTRFQLRVGTLLRKSFPRATLRTIARLVVLCYICGDFVEVRNNKLCIRQLGAESKRNELTPDAVYQKLRDSRLR